MPPDSLAALSDSTAFFTIPQNFNAWLVLLKNLAAIIGTSIVGLLVLYFSKFLPWWRTRRDRVKLEKGLSNDIYSRQIIELALRYYVEPYCRGQDPAGSEEPRYIKAQKEPIFDAVDEYLQNPSDYRYIFLLADSGMGKTAFMINYYARNLRNRRRKFEIALLPLGIPDVDQRIQKISNHSDTVLFLDAFDEDTLAIVDHAQRLKELLALTRNFKKVLITCRTQFFPKDEEIPKETGVIKVGPRGAGESGEYYFHKIYLSPFTDEQVNTYIKKRYPFWKRKRRTQAKAMVDRIPNLAVRPMLLTHINELVKREVNVSSTYELYDEMVKAWLVREEGILGVKQEPIRHFSEQLAVDLWINRSKRKAERINKDELLTLAKQWEIPLEDWQMTGRSLLNRDAVGNYKFAHRSIMEFLFVKRFFEMPVAERPEVVWTDQMTNFFIELAEFKKVRGEWAKMNFAKIDIASLLTITNRQKFELRKTAVELTERQVISMLNKHNFFDNSLNIRGSGIEHLYLPFGENDKCIMDVYTGLYWQQSGSPDSMIWNDTQKYIKQLNEKNFGGFSDWRLPTLEEAMSLMERERKKGDFYIDPVFDEKQPWIWTADRQSASRAWLVTFDGGYCSGHRVDFDLYARAVRS
ncbi:MAG: DUF1566 domain-containing protein [Calditrichia bacterium]